ncbi:MAG: imidazole glycerol phosphate synthase subunit HisH [Sulfurimonas sp.]|nr:imidazole glycerol phosphate synthase subunit HisH [Sulfurimonas sp.]
MPNITIIDYGLGNLRSIKNAFKHLGIECNLSCDKNTILNSDAIVLPGVGAFGHAMEILTELNLISTISEFANSGKPLLGICLGMQLLFDESDEFGVTKGLGLINGRVQKLKHVQKLPHIGWNSLCKNIDLKNTILDNLNEKTEFYFVHSYAVVTNEIYILSSSKYDDITFCSSVKKENIYGCQFHPEKSGEFGLSVLENFINITKGHKC